MTKKIITFLFGIIIFFGFAACGGPPANQTATPSIKIYLVDPVFREFYSYLGGRAVLGDAISPIMKSGNKRYQYTMGAMMIIDQQAPANRRFQLGPIGKELGFVRKIETNLKVAGQFAQLYTRLGGESLVGRPITGLLYNSESKNTEQYFENLGFYQGEQSGGSVHLFPYGAWQCGDGCKELLLENNVPIMPTPTQTLKGGEPTAPPSQELSLEVWVSFPTIKVGQEQEIGVSILKNDLPIEGVAPRLVIYSPNGSITYELPLTKSDGSSSILLPAAEGKNNTIIPFKVCVISETNSWICVKESYLIWNSS